MPINYSYYPANWKSIRKRILLRANDRCEHCGVKNYSVIVRREGKAYELLSTHDMYDAACQSKKGDHPDAIVIVLTVAHLDHDEWNHQVKDERLAALCQRCHFHYDRPDNDKRKKYGKHYKKNQIELL